MDNLGQTAEGPQPTLAVMRRVQRWLIWQSVPEPGKKPRKVPHYVSGARRHGTLDTPEDWSQLATYDQAKSALAGRGDDWGLAFALGPDGEGGHWQGFDLDDITAKGLDPIALNWRTGECAAFGYAELSPSATGIHVIGYGAAFATLGPNDSGIEAYASGRFFTVTENAIRADGALVDLAGYVEQHLAPRHSAARTSQANASVETEPVDAKTVTELRSALAHMPSDDRDLWVRMGMALRVLGQRGEGLWTEWSQKSEKYDAKDAARVWRSLKPSDTGYQAVFAEAQRQGWVNPSSNAAQLAKPAAPKAEDETPEAMLARMRVDWINGTEDLPPDIVEGLVADKDVTLLGGHGGIGKSFLALQMACAVALGQPILKHDTQQQRVLYYAAEDPGWRLSHRLRKIRDEFSYDQAALDRNLCVLDASEVDPLYGETWEDMGSGEKSFMVKMLGGTDYFTNLQRMVQAFDPQLVVIDGASDTYDGDEIVRRQVRGFIKLLRRVHPKRKIGVLLMVHIDRNSARGNETTDDGYAGSTQWHNSCRRRMWLQAEVAKSDETKKLERTGTFFLRVMKHQDGKPMDDEVLSNAEGGIWKHAVTFGGDFAPGKRPMTPPPDYGPAIAKLIRDYYDRGHWISASMAVTATSGVYGTLQHDPEFPDGLRKAKRASSATIAVVQRLLREGCIEAEDYDAGHRNRRQRWKVLRVPEQVSVPPEEET